MERREDIKVKSGFEYDHYFPKAKLITITKKEGATVADTILLIPAVVSETLLHTKQFALEVIKADTLEETCNNLWQFVTDHIAYKKDEDGKEQVRSPARAWHDRHNTDANGEPMGVDCDCYTVFISSVLSNLNIKHKLRITKYKENYFQHIYPIVPLQNGSYITIDCVVRSFDYEEPYTEKKDTNMDLEYLNGVSDTSDYKAGEDIMGLMGEEEALSELGKLFKRKAAPSGSGGAKKEGSMKSIFKPKTDAAGGQQKGGKVKNFLKKGLHVTNRLNPATAALRAGVLAAMKLNFMKIGGQIRYAYLTEEQAKQKGLVMDRWRKMKNIREKLEKIFYGAGGKPENLKKAILTGKGNKNKEVPVNGLGYISYENVDGLNEDMALSQLIGREMYSSEMEGVHGLGELGEPATAATIAAASTVLTTIAALIKSVGSLVPKKKGEGGGESGSDEGGGEDSGGDSSSSEGSSESEGSEGSSSDEDSEEGTNGSASSEGGGEDEGGSANRSVQKSGAKTTKPSFWDDNKKWIKPVGYSVGAIGLIALIYQLLKPKLQPKSKAVFNGFPVKRKQKSRNNLLNGIQIKKKKGGNLPAKRKGNAGKKKVVTLL